MRRIDFQIGPEQEGWRVEQYLRRVQGMSSRVITKLKHHPQGLLLNDAHIRTIDPIHTGDVLSVTIVDQPQPYFECDTEVEILYEDDDVMVYNKPSRMPCHQAKHHQSNTLANVFARHCRERGLQLSFRCINRLDQDTSGAVVVAKNAHCATKLTGVGRGGIAVEKRYTALLVGILPYERGVIDANIDRLGEDYINRIVAVTGQFARTEFEVMGYGSRYTLASFRLHTGRTHQIRVHMGWLGYPLAGDDLYGWDTTLLQRQALHCAQVRFPHPVTGRQIVVDAPMFEDMKQAITMAGVLPKAESAHFKRKVLDR